MEFVYTIIMISLFLFGVYIGQKIKNNERLTLSPAKAIDNVIKQKEAKKLEQIRTKEEQEVFEGIQNILNYGNK